MKKVLAISILTALSGVGMAYAQQPAEGPRGGRGHHGPSFEQIDANNDGVVSKDEMLKDATAHFDKADTNKDGKVTQAERQAMRTQWENQRFTENDKNKDGALSADEMPGHMFDKMKKFDANNDGKLSKAELQKAHEARAEHMGKKFAKRDEGDHTKAELQKRVSERFDKLDTDSNGKLTKDELAAGHKFGRGHGHGRHGRGHDCDKGEG